MKKLIFLSAAALFASTAIASASVSVLSLDGFCNEYKVRKTGTLFAAKDSNTDCSAGFGGGVLATVSGQGKNAVVAFQDPASPGYQFEFTFSYPFVTGGTWVLYYTNDGVHFAVDNSGTYTLTTPAAGSGKGGKSVTAR